MSLRLCSRLVAAQHVSSTTSRASAEASPIVRHVMALHTNTFDLCMQVVSVLPVSNDSKYLAKVSDQRGECTSSDFDWMRSCKHVCTAMGD